MTGQQLIEHRPQSVNIGCGSKLCVIAGSLFRRHVTGCAQYFQRARNRALCFDQPRKTKIGKVGFTFLIEQDIPWLDIAMKNPVNILLDQKGEPHLTDFGLARLVETESTVTRTMEVLGTPSYMAPEQAVGN